MESNHPKHRNCSYLHPIGGGVSAKTPDTNSLAGINTLNSTPDAKSSSGFIQQINRLSEQEAIAQGYTVIKTAQDLDNIRNNTDADGNITGKYILMNDIDLSSYANWDPIGDVDTGEGFTGTLDGNGYVVKNLTINRPTEDGVGLFALIGDGNTMSGGEVKNLGLENVDVEGNNGTAGLASASAGNITNCYINGKINGNGAYATGGLVGQNLGTIKNCYSNCEVVGKYHYTGGLAGANQGQILNCFSTGTVTGQQEGAGGLIGLNMGGSILNSYSTAKIMGNIGVGGLIGSFEGGNVSNSYATGLVQGTTAVGGLVGHSESNAKIENSIWNTQTTGQNAAYGSDDGTGTFNNNKGLTTAEMQDPSNWSGWDTSIWDFSTYPPTFKMYTPTGGGSTGGGTGGTDPSDPSNPDNPNTPGGGTGGAGDVPIPGAVRLQIGSDSGSTSAIYVDTSFDLGAFDVDFSSADSCAAAIEDIDEVLSRINTKRSEFGAVINRLSSILESQTTTIQNFTSAKSTIMDADIANESADFVKNQILQQTSSALLAQSQNLHASIVLSLIG